MFGSLTLVENMVAAIQQPRRSLFRAAAPRAHRERAVEVLDEFGLAGLRDARADQLSFGQRKLLEFASVLMGRAAARAARRAHLGREPGDGRDDGAPHPRAARRAG